MADKTAPGSYANVTWLDIAKVAVAAIQLPVVLTYSLLTSPFVKHNSVKPWKRILSDTMVQHLTWNLNMQQLQYLFPTTSVHNYKAWVKAKGLPEVIEEISEDSRLVWIGPKRADKVLLYVHGGAYTLPLQDYHLSYLKHIQDKIKEKGLDVGVAALNYTLVPVGLFPTQLKQICAAVSHLIVSGVEVQNIQLAGDSAGGNLILQLFSHILHPLEGVPRPAINGRFGGAYLISPWASLRPSAEIASGQHPCDKMDIIGTRILNTWGEATLSGADEAHIPYMNTIHAPESWLKGVDQLVDRIWVTAGDSECLKDDILLVYELLKKHHKKVDLVVQKNAIHEDPLCDFKFSTPIIGELMPATVSWFISGFNGSQ